MKSFLILVSVCGIAFGTKAQNCSVPLIQGYRGDTAITIQEAKKLILTSFAAIDGCQVKHKLRSGSMYYFNANGDVVMVENFTSILDDATKLRLIGKLKPGIKLMLDEMRYGDENKLVPRLSVTIVKGPTYLSSSK